MFSIIQNKQRNTAKSAMSRRWRRRQLVNLRSETKLEPFGFSLWSPRKTNPKSELTHCLHKIIHSRLVSSRTSLRHVTFGNYHPSSVCRLFMAFVYCSLRRLNFSAIFLHHPVAEPSGSVVKRTAQFSSAGGCYVQLQGVIHLNSNFCCKQGQ